MVPASTLVSTKAMAETPEVGTAMSTTSSAAPVGAWAPVLAVNTMMCVAFPRRVPLASVAESVPTGTVRTSSLPDPTASTARYTSYCVTRAMLPGDDQLTTPATSPASTSVSVKERSETCTVGCTTSTSATDAGTSCLPNEFAVYTRTYAWLPCCVPIGICSEFVPTGMSELTCTRVFSLLVSLGARYTAYCVAVASSAGS
mmetsp:Transcript_70542/g.194966  ORF Transcript_70542/g.194966 Transcript_70542/m.194966 type:complete len:201 (-) Transcript_70542:18-620(-)